MILVILMAVFEALAAVAATRYFALVIGFFVAVLIIELRLNLRLLFNEEDNLRYRPILPVFFIPDWAITKNGLPTQKLKHAAEPKFKLFKGLNKR